MKKVSAELEKALGINQMVKRGSLRLSFDGEDEVLSVSYDCYLLPEGKETQNLFEIIHKNYALEPKEVI